ncbi:MAG: UbiD family decarboxylase, partial [Pseudomonadota bacterium]
AVLRRLGQSENPAVVFQNLSGYSIPVVGNLFGSRTRIALALETTKDKLKEKYLEAKNNPIPPVFVKDGPAKGVIIADNIDIPGLIPVLTHHRKDKNPYFTQAICFMKNPQTKTPTMGIHRMEVKGGNRLGIYLGSRTSTEYLRIAEEKNEPLEVAIVLGVDPGILLASVAWFPYGDKISLAGGLRGEPVELIKAETVDIEVPAHAAFVLEGKILPHVREQEGPFGESTGNYATFNNPVIEITTITHQKTPVYPATVPWSMEDELQFALAWGTETLKTLRQSYPSVLDLNLLSMTNAVISMKKKDAAQVREVLYLTLISNQFIKKAVVVDEDIDIYNHREVEWSLATRFQPDRDLIVISGIHGLPIDPSVLPGNITAKIGIDATKPEEGSHSFEKIDIPEEIMAKAETMLARYIKY